MINVEDITDPDNICNNPRHSKQVLEVTGTEAEISRLEGILLAIDPMTEDYEDEQVFKNFVHSCTSACC